MMLAYIHASLTDSPSSAVTLSLYFHSSVYWVRGFLFFQRAWALIARMHAFHIFLEACLMLFFISSSLAWLTNSIAVSMYFLALSLGSRSLVLISVRCSLGAVLGVGVIA